MMHPANIAELIHTGKMMDFKDFFIQVCKAKLESDFEELQTLRECVRVFSPIYGAKAVTYLCDCIDTERVLPFIVNAKSEKTLT